MHGGSFPFQMHQEDICIAPTLLKPCGDGREDDARMHSHTPKKVKGLAEFVAILLVSVAVCLPCLWSHRSITKGGSFNKNVVVLWSHLQAVSTKSVFAGFAEKGPANLRDQGSQGAHVADAGFTI